MSYLVFCFLCLLGYVCSASCTFNSFFAGSKTCASENSAEWNTISISSMPLSITCTGYKGKTLELFAYRVRKGWLDVSKSIKKLPCHQDTCTWDMTSEQIPLDLRRCDSNVQFYWAMWYDGWINKLYPSCKFRPRDYHKDVPNCHPSDEPPIETPDLPTGVCRCIDETCYPNGVAELFPGDGSMMDNGHPWCFVDSSCATTTVGNKTSCQRSKKAYMDGHTAWGPFKGVPASCKASLNLDNTTASSTDTYAGWYDVQGCGQCHEYCRWMGKVPGGDPSKNTVAGDSYWSCRLAGEKTDSTKGRFSSWSHQKCTEEASQTPGWARCELKSVRIIETPISASQGVKILAGSTATTCGDGGGEVSFSQSQDRSITNKVSLKFTKSFNFNIGVSVTGFAAAKGGLPWLGAMGGGALTVSVDAGGEFSATKEQSQTISETNSQAFGVKQKINPNSGAVFLLVAEEYKYPNMKLKANYTSQCGTITRSEILDVTVTASSFSHFKPDFMQKRFASEEECYRQKQCIQKINPVYGAVADIQTANFRACFGEGVNAGTMSSAGWSTFVCVICLVFYSTLP